MTIPAYSRELVLPLGDVDDLKRVTEAVIAEHRASAEWKQLRCLNVECIDPEEGLYRLDTGSVLGLEQSWEGSVALRPREGAPTAGAEPDEDAVLWSGPVVELDDTAGALYVGRDGRQGPTRGDFYVRPFDFVALLKRIYTGKEYASLRLMLCGRLRAAALGAPPVDGAMEAPWPPGWNILWGPPGTGKTHLIGERVAALLRDPEERVLVVSTTNDATDQAALSIGRATRSNAAAEGTIVRVGRGARYRRFADAGLRRLIEGREHQLRSDIDGLRSVLDTTRDRAERARLRHRLGVLVRELRGAAGAAASNGALRAVVTTAFHALSFACERSLVTDGTAPFTTVVVDEAGLISRATIAALSVLAARRVVLVGDPRQLAPIARMNRVLASGHAHWLGLSALQHLDVEQTGGGAEFLTHQHRMHPHIRAAVSAYQYGGRLVDASTLAVEADEELPAQRAIWYVLDEEKTEPQHLRADRGQHNRSWTRAHTPVVLERLFAAYPRMREGAGLFLSPFVGQTRMVSDHLRGLGAPHWRASTVHQQQGAEADYVVFDTVNAGSHCWPLDEWERLINVGVSRARKLAIVLATREEARQPFLAPLVTNLWPAALQYAGRAWRLHEVARDVAAAEAPSFDADDQRLGAQIVRRRALRPIFSSEQQRLSRFEMDGKPRLVRGVAGSGKTVVLAAWLVQTLLRNPDPATRYWVVFANEALRRLIQRCIEDAWARAGQPGAVPWSRIDLHHIDRLLASLERPVRVADAMRFEYGWRAKQILARGVTRVAGCQALFMDEAQDLGPEVIALLTQLTAQTDPDDPKSRAVNIFYDNAQNVYRRGTPRWMDLGIDLRGRSVVMKESFRSTRPITEFAVNVLARLTSFADDPDQREYIERGFIEETRREGRTWWQVNYNEVNGPAPMFRPYADRTLEASAVCDQIVAWIRDEGVQARDIAVLTMGYTNGRKNGELITRMLSDRLQPLGLRAEFRTREGFEGLDRTVAVTTPHSFKGYEAEVVCGFALDAFHERGQPIAAPLYVALTRARSLLLATATRATEGAAGKLFAALKEAGDLAAIAPVIDARHAGSSGDQRPLLLSLVGPDHAGWLDEVLGQFRVAIEPIVSSDGEVLGEPLFVARSDDRTIAVYTPDAEPSRSEALRLGDGDVEIALVGEPITE